VDYYQQFFEHQLKVLMMMLIQSIQSIVDNSMMVVVV
jgi:hypothetical protein